MSPRRRITSIVDQQHAFRELGIVRFSDPMTINPRTKKPLVGKPNEQPRVTGPNRSAIEQIATVYGDGTVEPFQPVNDPTRPAEWSCRVTDPQGLAIAVPPGIEPFTLAYERWNGGFLFARCDGANVQYRERGRWVESPCRCDRLGLEYGDPDRCKRYLRLQFAIIGVREFGTFRVNSTSFHASRELPIALAILQRSGRAGRLRIERRSDKALLWDPKANAGAGEDKPTGRKYPVLTVSAPFLIDELVQIERAPDMLALPMPQAPALPAGTRPQIGPGGELAPTGPQFDDVAEPPADVPAPALPEEEPAIEPDDVQHPDEPEGPEAPGEAQQLPIDEGTRRSAGREALDRIRERGDA